MKIPIYKKIIDHHLDIDFPAYYSHYLSDHDEDNVIYGKLTPEQCITIQKRFREDGEKMYEIEVIPSIDIERYMSYLTNPEYASNEEEFVTAYKQMIDFIMSHR